MPAGVHRVPWASRRRNWFPAPEVAFLPHSQSSARRGVCSKALCVSENCADKSRRDGQRARLIAGERGP